MAGANENSDPKEEAVEQYPNESVPNGDTNLQGGLYTEESGPYGNEGSQGPMIKKEPYISITGRRKTTESGRKRKSAEMLGESDDDEE